MPSVELFVGILLAIAVITGLATRVGFPAQPLLVLAGLGAGFLPFIPAVHVQPDLVFAVFLPPILYASAFEFAAEDVRSVARAIGFLATALVIATVVLVAVAAHHILALPWAPAFVLGAVVAPTDPLAATGIIRGLGAPSRLATILEGEALLNDGTALVTYQVAVAAVGAATFSLWGAAGDFLVDSLGGLAIGAAIAWSVGWIRRRVRQASIETTLSVAVAYGSFVTADRLGVSGILATVMAGMVVGRSVTEWTSPQARLQTSALWEALSFLAESALFLLIGLEFEGIAGEVHGRSAATVVGDTFVVIAAVVLARAVWMFTVPYVLRATRLISSGDAPSPKELVLLAVSGMRGAVSVAAALAVPLVAGGAPFPDRPVLLISTYGTVLATMVAVPLLLPWLVRRLGLEEGEARRRRRREARKRLVDAALKEAEELGRDGAYSDAALQRVRELYEMRLLRIDAEEEENDPEGDGRFAAEYHELRRRLAAVERDALDRLRDEVPVEGETLRELERQLDLEAARVQG